MHLSAANQIISMQRSLCTFSVPMNWNSEHNSPAACLFEHKRTRTWVENKKNTMWLLQTGPRPNGLHWDTTSTKLIRCWITLKTTQHKVKSHASRIGSDPANFLFDNVITTSRTDANSHDNSRGFKNLQSQVKKRLGIFISLSQPATTLSRQHKCGLNRPSWENYLCLHACKQFQIN